MSRRGTLPFLVAGLLALVMAAGCGDDDSPTGGGGNGGNTLSLPAGAYAASGTFFDCATQGVNEAVVDTLVFCSSEVLDEFFAVDCPVRRTGNNLSVSCTRTYQVGTGCEETVTIDVRGTVSGDHYELHGTLSYSDDPANCWDGAYCDSLYLTVDKIGDAPSACQYASANTIALTVTGGPQAGQRTLDAFGTSDNAGGSIQFTLNGFGGVPAAARTRTPSGINGIAFHATTPYLNPAQLPINLTVIVSGIGARTGAAGGNEVVVNYDEYAAGFNFSAESATTGAMVVRELADDYIAGTMSMTLTGTEFSDQYPGGQPAQRTLSGGYYVTTSGELSAAPPTAGERLSRLVLHTRR